MAIVGKIEYVKVEMSDLSGYETHDAKSARVEIFRYIDQEGWWLEVIDQAGNLTRWDVPFKTVEMLIWNFAQPSSLKA